MSGHSVVCLRCGYCCLFYRIVFPNGWIKPGGMNCPFLIPRQKENNQWKLAICTFYGLPERPKACSRYCGQCTPYQDTPFRKEECPGGVCPDGLQIWQGIKKENPEDVFPSEIEKYLSS